MDFSIYLKIKVQETGRLGEDYAAVFFMNQGYDILERNYRFKKTEIDLILRKDKLLVAVEVKTRKGIKVGSPMDAISKIKQRHLIQGINHYILQYQEPIEVRMDALGVVIHGSKVEYTHIEDAFPAF